jgi:hypothetical protein
MTGPNMGRVTPDFNSSIHRNNERYGYRRSAQYSHIRSQDGGVTNVSRSSDKVGLKCLLGKAIAGLIDLMAVRIDNPTIYSR